MASDVTKKSKMGPRLSQAAIVAAAALLCGPLTTPALADSLITKMHNISDTLKNDLSGVLDTAVVHYSEPDINTTYTSNTVFNMKGMGILYNVTPHVIDFLMQKDAYPEGLVKVRDGHVEFEQLADNWKVLLVHYAGIVSVVLLVAIFVVFFPLAGLCWCCCYCAHSRNRQPFDRKNDSCIKGVLALLLICVITLFMFGVVCSFVTDEHIESSTEELPDTQRRAMSDVRAFLNATDAHQRHLLITNYKELEAKLQAMIDSSGMKVSLQLGEFSRAVSVTTLNKMVQDLDKVRANLALVKNVTVDLRYNAERLDQGLRKVKYQLLETLRNCSQEQCRRIQEKYKIGELSADIDYSQLPDVTLLLEKVNDLITGNIKTEVEEGQRVFNNLKRRIETSVNQHIPTMKTAITDTGKEIANISERISEMVSEAEQFLRQDGGHVAQEIVEQYGPYRRYAGIGVCTFILTILLTLVLGLLCGVCGKRPEGYGNNDCCNKGSGSRCLISGTVLMFLLGWAVAVVVLVYFLAGLVSQRFVCDPLAQPQGNRLFADVESLVQLEHAMFHTEEEPDFNMANVIAACHRNETIYQVLHLHRILDLEQLQERVRRELKSRVAQLARETTFSQPHLVILKQSARDKLRRLADTGLSDFPFDKFTDVLVTNITSINLSALARQLTATADEIQQRPEFSKVTMDLRDAAGTLHMYQRDIVDHMLRETAELNDTAIQLRDGLKFNHSSFKNAVEYLLDETASAEKFLSTQGPGLIRNLTRDFASGVAKLVEVYLQRVVNAARDDVGRCGPVSNVYDSLHSAVCRKILLPVNGFWLSLAWCLLLFIPIIMISSKLAKLYTNTDPYPGPLVEAAYLGEKRARRERGGGERGGGERGGGERVEEAARGGGRSAGSTGGGEGGRRGAERAAVALEGQAPPLDAHNARRYNDMAPKHWEEGPPRYHGPTEYERPPPYYYPGPNDRE